MEQQQTYVRHPWRMMQHVVPPEHTIHTNISRMRIATSEYCCGYLMFLDVLMIGAKTVMHHDMIGLMRCPALHLVISMPIHAEQRTSQFDPVLASGKSSDFVALHGALGTSLYRLTSYCCNDRILLVDCACTRYTQKHSESVDVGGGRSQHVRGCSSWGECKG